MSAALSKRIATPAALKMEALRHGSARGEAGGWGLVLTKPGFKPPPELVLAAERMARHIAERDGKPAQHPTVMRRTALGITLSDWWFSAKRIDQRVPNATQLRFLRQFAVDLGAPENIEPIAAYCFLWSPEKANDRC